MRLEESILKRDEKTSYALRELYQQYGYSRFKMGKFEEYDLYIRNKDFLVSDRMITFAGPDGTLMALKPDVTISIIKNTQEGDSGVRKVYYNENVYRTSKGDAAFREIMQTGLECIGALDCYHVYEVISLAVKSLQAVSPAYVLDISHMGLISGLMASAGVPEEQYGLVLQCVREKNAAELRRYCAGHQLSEEGCALLQRLISTYGAMQEVLDQLQPLCTTEKTQSAWGELHTIAQLLDANGLAEGVKLDFSVVNDMNYYNGIVFQGFVQGLASGILSGGQYDKLVQKMGKPFGAIGFAIYLDQLERLEAPQPAYDTDVLVLYDSQSDLNRVTRMVAEQTALGQSVLAQREEPQGLRYRTVLDLRKEASR